MNPPAPDTTPSGIGPLDERLGGLDDGGAYLVVGPPGPALLVATLQFLHAGLRRGETALLLTSADAESILGVARDWGLELDAAWRTGALQILGFRDGFELRAVRSVRPEDVVDELDELVEGEPSRIGVDPGSLLLTSGSRTRLAAAFLDWARRRPATVLATFSTEAVGSPSAPSADWLVAEITGRLVLEPTGGGLHQLSVVRSDPRPDDPARPVPLRLEPGAGLVEPERHPDHRGPLDEGRLLLLTLDAGHGRDLLIWAEEAFRVDVVDEEHDAVARLRNEAGYGHVLVHAPRSGVRDAVRACRALRPLTGAAIVFASDDGVRSTDRLHLLEAGADDCLAGGLDFRELALRMRRSLARRTQGTPEAPGDTARSESPQGGRVTRAAFRSEIEARAGHPELAFFCVLDIRCGALPAQELEGHLVGLVRAEQGDLVTRDGEQCLALLQGAREGQLGSLIDRLRARIARDGAASGPFDVRVFGHPSDAARIDRLLSVPVGKGA